MSQPQQILAGVVDRHGLPRVALDSLTRLLQALAEEPDPHTTVAEPVRAAPVHVADSLSALALPELAAPTAIADIGAGPGFPGLPLAIARPSTRVDLLESQQRKTAVIARLAAAAGVPNARPVTARAEEWASASGREAYDAVTARAVAPLAVLAEYAAPLLRIGGALVAWKGARDPVEELAGATAAGQLGMRPLRVVAVEPYTGSHSRHLHLYLKESETPARYPRRAGMAAKRPLA